MSSSAETLNSDAAMLDRAALHRAMQAQGSEWHNLVTERCPHLFADVPLFISTLQMRQMSEVIAAVERVVAQPKWNESNWFPRGGESLGVFFGYDFHLNSEGAHLIEINSNAGGGFLNALLQGSQRDSGCPGVAVAQADIERVFVEMFRNEWRLARGDAPLQTVAIVDERPEEQYLYPEFLLAQRMFERFGIEAFITDPAALHLRGDGLHLDLSGDCRRIDLVYNRLTDFSLQQHPALLHAYLQRSAVVTPNPAHFVRYADKRNLVRLGDADTLRELGACEADIQTLHAGVPQTMLVDAKDHQRWWQERRQWFFKPASGYGSKGSYSGAKLTRRVFDEIMQGAYVAQRLAAPGTRALRRQEEQVWLKSDVRCYVYEGQVLLVAARLYQGQVTNFRTPGGGFAPVYLVE